MSTEATYDIEFVEGEEGIDDPYIITVKNKDGTPADISWATLVELYIKTKDLATQRMVAKSNDSTNPLVVVSPTVKWPMPSTQTSGYTGEHIAQIICSKTTGGNRKRKTYFMSVMVYPKTD